MPVRRVVVGCQAVSRQLNAVDAEPCGWHSPRQLVSCGTYRPSDKQGIQPCHERSCALSFYRYPFLVKLINLHHRGSYGRQSTSDSSQRSRIQRLCITLRYCNEALELQTSIHVIDALRQNGRCLKDRDVFRSTDTSVQNFSVAHNESSTLLSTVLEPFVPTVPSIVCDHEMDRSCRLDAAPRTPRRPAATSICEDNLQLLVVLWLLYLLLLIIWKWKVFGVVIIALSGLMRTYKASRKAQQEVGAQFQ